MIKKILGYILIIISIIVTYAYHSDDIRRRTEESKKINQYLVSNQTYDKQDEAILAILEIPKIKLKKPLYNIDSKLNNVNKNIEVLHESTMPNHENGSLILASHSGNSKISYFKNLNKLSINDELIIYYNKEKYIYKITNIYKANKTGSIELIRNPNKRVLSLITCDKSDRTKQVVYISELDYIESI